MYKRILVVVTVLSCLLTGCSSDNNSNQEYPSDYPTSKSYTVDEILYPEASGALVLDSDVAKVDYSNTNQGYVMAFLKPGVSKRIKIQISWELGRHQFLYKMEIKKLLEEVVTKGASDIFIVAGSPCAIKIDGRISKYSDERLTPHDTERMIRDIYEIANNAGIEEFMRSGDDDFSFSFPFELDKSD